MGPTTGPRIFRYFAAAMVAASLIATPAWAGKPAKKAASTWQPPLAASIIVDGTTGELLYSDNSDSQTYPASLTKMMTLYLTFEALQAKKLTLNTRLPVSKAAAAQAPSKLYLEPGETITVENAILALTTKSANDAAVVLAEALGDTETNFAQVMTRKAAKLGMTRTVYRNASGLPNKGQVTTARDQVILAQALYRDFPDRYHYFSQQTFDYKGQQIASHNRLLGRYEGADGLKTGFIRDSGFNLAASAERDGRRIFGVVLGGSSSYARDVQMMHLLDKGFDTQPTLTVASRLNPRTNVVARPLPNNLPTVKQPIEQGDAAAPKPHEASVLSTAGIWGVQVGAFQRFVQAQLAAARAAEAVPEYLASATAVVIPVEIDKGMLYRARLTGLATREMAEQACRTLTERHQIDCKPIQSGQELAALKN
ncbi:MAG: serine hydrolase [Alphaproteobacteria bacterium]